MVSNKTKTDLE